MPTRDTEIPVDPNGVMDMSEWRDVSIQVENIDGKTVKVSAKVYGRIGVCESPNAAGYWLVVPIMSGLATARLSSELDALRVAKVLWDKCYMAYRLGTKEAVLNALPNWVKPWCYHITDMKKYKDSAPWEEKYP